MIFELCSKHTRQFSKLNWLKPITDYESVFEKILRSRAYHFNLDTFNLLTCMHNPVSQTDRRFDNFH